MKLNIKPIQEGRTKDNSKPFTGNGRQAPPPPKLNKTRTLKRLNNRVDYGDEILSNDQILSRIGNGHYGNGWMDAECVDLCDTINSMKGLETVESCCGHNDRPYRIFFKCHSIPALRFMQSCIDNRYWKYGHEWSITSHIGDTGPEPLFFLLESKSNKLAEIMPQVEDMIDTFNHYLNHKNRFEFLGLDYSNFIYEEIEEHANC